MIIIQLYFSQVAKKIASLQRRLLLHLILLIRWMEKSNKFHCDFLFILFCYFFFFFTINGLMQSLKGENKKAGRKWNERQINKKYVYSLHLLLIKPENKVNREIQIEGCPFLRRLCIPLIIRETVHPIDTHAQFNAHISQYCLCYIANALSVLVAVVVSC